MGLNTSLNIAANSIDDIQKRINVTARNISGAADEDYVHQTVASHMRNDGGAYTTVTRDANDRLLEDYLAKRSKASGAAEFSDNMKELDAIFSTKEFAYSPFSALSELKKSLQFYINQTDKNATSENVISNAQNLANNLNFATTQLNRLRKDADTKIASEVKEVNQLLGKLKALEKHIVNNNSEDVYGYMDQRDAVLKELSSHISITFNKHADGSVAVYATNGTTLFDKIPRKVTFDSTQLQSGKPGGVVKIDGVPLTHESFVAPNGDGSLGNLLRFRDDVCIKSQNQLDVLAVNLVKIFDGIGSSSKGSSSKLFTADISNTAGVAGRIKINPKFITSQNGNSNLLGNKANLQKIIDKMSSPAAFDYGQYNSELTGLHKGHSLLSFAKESLSWTSNLVKSAYDDSEYKITMFNHSEQTLSNQTGVNKDDESALMLQLKMSFDASGKIIAAISKMMDDFLAAIR